MIDSNPTSSRRDIRLGSIPASSCRCWRRRSRRLPSRRSGGCARASASAFRGTRSPKRWLMAAKAAGSSGPGTRSRTGSVDGVTVAIAQVGATVEDIEANLTLADRYAERAARRGAQLIVFPECFVQGYSVRRQVLDLAEPIDGP